MRKLNILIAGRSSDEVESVERLLAEHPRCRVRCKIISNGHTDPLHDASEMPDLLLLGDMEGAGELQTLMSIPAGDRPELIVFGHGNDPEMMRLAMRAGARDYLTLPLEYAELVSNVTQIHEKISADSENQVGGLHVFVNGKGGSGATFLATNVAHGLATDNHSVTLVDLDLQFAGMCRYLDVTPTRDLMEAVQAVDDMDAVSAEAYTTRHESGLRILAGSTNELRLTADLSPERVVKTLRAYQAINDYVIVDLPRHIDLLSAAILESADQITVVTQQSFPHLHDTSRLLHILRSDIGIHNDQLTVVVNRYDKNSAILVKDIENALRLENIVKIPNHYRLTSESVNTGVPLSEMSKKASVVKGLKDLYHNIGGKELPDSGGPASKFQSLFRR